MLDAVNPGAATRTCNPFFKFSTRNVFKNPRTANLLAEYPVLPGSPRKPATEIIPTKLPFVFNI